MNKYIKGFLGTILATMIGVIPVNGAAYTKKNDDCSAFIGEFNNEGKAVVTGNLIGANEEHYVNITVFCPGVIPDGLTYGIGNNISEIAYIAETRTDSEGNFTYTLELPGKSGRYSAYFGIIGEGESLADVPVYYSNTEENKIKLGELNELTDTVSNDENGIEKIKNFVNTNQYALAFKFNLYDGIGCDEHCEYDSSCGNCTEGVNQSDVARYLYEYLKDTKFDVNDRSTASGIFRGLVVMQALKENMIDDIEDYCIYIPIIESGELKEWKAKTTNAEIKEFTKRLKNSEFSNVAEFNSAMIESAVLSRVHNADGYGEVEDILKQFSDEIKEETGMATDSLSISIYKKLRNCEFRDYSELAKKIKEIKESTSESGSPGGGGSHVSAGATETVIPTPVNPVESEEKSEDRFNDVKAGMWYYEAVTTLAKKGVLAGKSDKVFAPNDTVTREEFVKMAIVALGYNNTPLANLNFGDVKENDWFYEYVAKAVEAKLVTGISDNNFGAGQPITRQDLCVIIHRIGLEKGLFGEEEAKLSFSDTNEIAEYAVEAVSCLAETKIVNGTGDGCFAPYANATRAEAAKIIYGFMNKLK